MARRRKRSRFGFSPRLKLRPQEWAKRLRHPALLFLGLASCSIDHAGTVHGNQLTVTVTAYNSTTRQTEGDPFLAAWGDRLKPGDRIIAVSRDLLDQGLRHNSRVRIEGIPGTWLVQDKMHWRWYRRIDLYMGTDVAAARRFGKQELTIRW